MGIGVRAAALKGGIAWTSGQRRGGGGKREGRARRGEREGGGASKGAVVLPKMCVCVCVVPGTTIILELPTMAHLILSTLTKPLQILWQRYFPEPQLERKKEEG